MKSPFFLLIVWAVFAGWVNAEIPRKAPLTKYQGLWTNSPFTTKPPPPGPDQPQANPLDDYALAGVSPIKGGYRVTIINKKQPDERKYVYSDQADASHGFKVLSVQRDAKNVRGTVVHMMSGSQKGTVTYDEKLLAISTPPAPQQANGKGPGKGPGKGQGNPNQPAVSGAPQVPNQPGVPGANQPGQPGQPGQQGAVRAPRPRVIGPPPVPQAPTTPQNTTPPAAVRPPRR